MNHENGSFSINFAIYGPKMRIVYLTNPPKIPDDSVGYEPDGDVVKEQREGADGAEIRALSPEVAELAMTLIEIMGRFEPSMPTWDELSAREKAYYLAVADRLLGSYTKRPAMAT